MTNEDYTFLSGFEKNFETAIKFSYSSAIPVKDIDKMLDIIHKTEPGYTTNKSCSRCVLSLLTKIGQMYYDFKNTLEAETEPETKPKKSRKSQKDSDL